VKQCGWHAFAGVCTRDASDEAEIRHGTIFSGLECGFCFGGWANGHTLSPPFHIGELDQDSVHRFCSKVPTYFKEHFPLFQPGDHVGLLLDCDSGYFINFSILLVDSDFADVYTTS